MTLSLLKNKDEFEKLKIPAHKNAKLHSHPDIDWIRVEHRKYSKKFTDCKPEIDEMAVQWSGLYFNNCKSKTKLLKITKMMDSIMYFDLHFYQIWKSEKELKEFLEKLENVLINSQTIQGFSLGMRFKESMDEIMADMTERQSKDLKIALKDFLNAQKYVHYELGLSGKFIPIEDFFDIRGKEGIWPISYLLVEFGLEISLTDQIYDKIEIKQFLCQMNRYCMSCADSFDFKAKLARNDISSHIISCAVSSGCSLQEAVNMNDIEIKKSKLRSTELQKSIMKNDLLNSSEVERFMNALFDSIDGMLQWYYECNGNEIKDGLVYNKKWENMLK